MLSLVTRKVVARLRLLLSPDFFPCRSVVRLFFRVPISCMLRLISFPQVSQLVKESQRFQPMHADVGLSIDEDEENDIDSPPADDYIVNVGDLEGEDEDVGSQDDGELPGWAVLDERVKAAREQYRRHENDTGSPECQVAGMTERIAYLTKHMQDHPKDFSTRRGLVALVNKRRRLLNYLCKEDVERYKEIVASLGIRHKASGQVRTREEQYSRFPGQKAVKKHLVKKK